MMKEIYERTELDTIKFETDDIIMTSDPVDDDEPQDRYMMPVR